MRGGRLVRGDEGLVAEDGLTGSIAAGDHSPGEIKEVEGGQIEARPFDAGGGRYAALLGADKGSADGKGLADQYTANGISVLRTVRV